MQSAKQLVSASISDTLPVPLQGDNARDWRALLCSPLPKQYYKGTQRTQSPQATLRWARQHFPAMGITRIANITGLDCIGVPVVMVCRPNARSLSTSLGKGLDLDSAIVSGVMECTELHHAERIMLPLVFASEAEMRSRVPVVETQRLPRIRNSRFHSNFPVLWIQGCDLVSGKGVWLPFEVVHASAAVPPASGSGCFASTSNGLASGNHRLEALVHALLEVIERDATAVWGAGGQARRERTTVDLNSVTDPGCLSVIERCHRAGVHVTVFETTSDLGIPCFLCEVREAQSELARSPVFSGLGCHIDSGIALFRALTEAVQSRLTLIAGSRDDLSRRDYLESGYPPPDRVVRPFNGMRAAGDTFNQDFQLLLDRLIGRGFEQIIAVDLTLPEFRIPVVRVVVPGLEGPDDDPEYVPGPRAHAARRRSA